MNWNATCCLMLALLAISLRAEQKPMTCNQSLTESYGIISYMQPAKERLLFCGSIKATCCPAFEQFKMYADFKSNIQPNFITMNKLIVTELKLLKTEIDALMKSKKLEQKIAAHPEKVMQAKLQNEYQHFANKNIAQIIDKMLTHQEVSSNYMSAIKSALVCTVCDYTNQMFIDTKKKIITYNLDTCDALAKNTILYSYLLNRVLVPYLEKLSYVIAKLRNSSKFQKLHNHGKVEKAIKDCQQDMLTSETNTGLSGCKNYCSLFQANSENFIFEGYPELFANTLVDIRQFVKDMPSQHPDPPKTRSPVSPATPNSTANAPASSQTQPASGNPASAPAPTTPPVNPPVTPPVNSSPPPTTPAKARKLHHYNKNPKTSWNNRHNHSWRVLAEINRKNQKENLEEIHDQLVQRILEAKPATKSPSSSPTVKREIDDFNFEGQIQEIDIFDLSSEDPAITDAMLDDMMIIQNAFNSADKGDFQKLIKQFLVERFKPEIEDIDDDQVFKTASNERINLGKFKSEFGFAGIDLDGIINKMNWALDTKKIAMSLVGGEDEGSEVIDNGILDIVNSVGNNDVKKFHADNYAQFLDVQASSLNEAINDEFKAAQTLVLEQQILEETAVYNYLVKNFKTKAQADEIWEDLQNKKKQLTKLKTGAEPDLNQGIGAAGTEVTQEMVKAFEASSNKNLKNPTEASANKNEPIKSRKLHSKKNKAKVHRKRVTNASKHQHKALKNKLKSRRAAKKASKRKSHHKKAHRKAKRGNRRH
jgi:hypothetical protein